MEKKKNNPADPILILKKDKLGEPTLLLSEETKAWIKYIDYHKQIIEQLSGLPKEHHT